MNVSLFESQHTKLKSKYFYGIQSDVRNNMHFLEENTIFYPINHFLVYHNLEKKTQSFLKLPGQHKVINTTAVAPNRQLVAIAEVSHRPSVSVYNLLTKNRIKILGNPIENSKATKFEFVSFTYDNNFLVAVSGEPEWMIFYYDWRTGRILNYYPLLGKNVHKREITDFSCNPSDNSVVAIGGPKLFNLLTNAENTWVKFGYQKAKRMLVSSLCWLTSDLVIVGTSDGRLAIIKFADLVGVYNIDRVTSITLELKKLSDKQELLFPKAPKRLRSGTYVIHALAGFETGFACSYFPGTITYFEKTGPTSWLKKMSYYCPSPVLKEFRGIKDIVNTISASPSGEKLVCTTGVMDIYLAEGINRELVIRKNKSNKKKLKSLTNGYHQGPISVISVCLWKPIFLSVGAQDKTCRLWNYQRGTPILTKEFPENVLSADIHPSGYYCIISFNTKIDFMMILVDDIQRLKSLNIRNCPIVKFSKHGHLFAALSNLEVIVYSLIDFQLLFKFRDDTPSQVTSFAFANEDRNLWTCCEDEKLNKWDLATGASSPVVIPKCGNIALTVVGRGTQIVLVGYDGRLRNLEGNQVLYELNVKQYTLYAVEQDFTKTAVFVGGEKCSIASVAYPLSYPPIFIEYFMHTTPIRKLVATPTGNILISLGEDGVIGLWKIKTKVKPQTKIPRVNEVLTSLSSWFKIDRKIIEQRRRLVEMANEHGYILGHIHRSHEKKIVELDDSFKETLNKLKTQIEHAKVKNLIEMYNYEILMEKKSNNFKSKIEAQSWEIEKAIKQEGLLNREMEVQIQKVRADVANVLQDSKDSMMEIIDNQNTVCDRALNQAFHKTNKINKQMTKAQQKQATAMDHLHINFKTELQNSDKSYAESLENLQQQKKLLVKENKYLVLKMEKIAEKKSEADQVVQSLIKECDRMEIIAIKLVNELDASRSELEEKDCSIARKDELVTDILKQNECFANEAALDMNIDQLKFQAKLEPMFIQHKARKKQEEALKNKLNHINKTIARTVTLLATEKQESSKRKTKKRARLTSFDKQMVKVETNKVYTTNIVQKFQKKKDKTKSVQEMAPDTDFSSAMTDLNSMIYCLEMCKQMRIEIKKAMGRGKSFTSKIKAKENYDINTRTIIAERNKLRLKQREYLEIYKILNEELSQLLATKLALFHSIPKKDLFRQQSAQSSKN